jgi:hypothetical protein
VAAPGWPGSTAWRELALEIERHRRVSGISSRISALGAAPPRSGEGRDWERLAKRISKYQGVAGVGFDELCVFPGQRHQLQEQAALPLLEACRWLGVLAPREIQTIVRMPTLVLRRHVIFAVLLLNGPPRRSMKLSPLQIDVTGVRAHQAAHEAAARAGWARLRALRDRPAWEIGPKAVRLRAKLEMHQAALARLPVVERKVDRLQLELRRGGRQAARSSRLHQLLVAIGLHSAYELARRDLEAVIALERDPPEYMIRALGIVPFATGSRAAWREGARLIERYRAEHGIEDLHEALGPRPKGHNDSCAHLEVAEQLQRLRADLHRGIGLDGRHAPDELPDVDLGSM